MLNPSEQRRLRAIERSLQHDDPELVERLRTAEWKQPLNRSGRYLAAVTVAGLVLVLCGLILGPSVSLLGMVLAIAGFWLRVVLAWSAEPDEQNGTIGPDGPR